MKSLAESILSSTGSGKNKKIDVEYLLTHGFERDINISPKTRLKHKETGYFLRIFEDKIVALRGLDPIMIVLSKVFS